MTKIQWTQQTWNPIVGCSVYSSGCTNCYAMKMASRLEAIAHADNARRTDPSHGGKTFDGPLSHYIGTTQRVNGHAVWTGKVNLAPPHTLADPLKRKRPTTYFVNSMSDLFHGGVPDNWITQVFTVMAATPWHTYQVLTKRSRRMRDWLSPDERGGQINASVLANALRSDLFRGPLVEAIKGRTGSITWPLPNVWVGVSCERQQEADERIPHLLTTPAAVRFVSAEPLIGSVNFTRISVGPDTVDALRPRMKLRSDSGSLAGDFGREPRDCLSWIIVGGESGPGARPMALGWAKDIVRQCKSAGVPVFVKQMGANPTNRVGHPCPHIKARKGDDMLEWPEELRVREFPSVSDNAVRGDGNRETDAENKKARRRA